MHYRCDDHVLHATSIILVSGHLSWSCRKQKVVPKKKSCQKKSRAEKQSRAEKKNSRAEKKSRVEKKKACQKKQSCRKKKESYRLRTTHLPLRTEYLITLRRRAAETYPICDDPLSTTRRRTFAPLLTDCAEITALLRYGV